ncbi:TonB-dependent receptor [Niabella aurantiaca]|uniref:TonB-dependent receptor n=1 Tax=Niabella aurantiaca TaxID=379900 RepID=UPI00035DF895|nr:TonB-dependent receptor [Niabella aurantiaca]
MKLTMLFLLFFTFHIHASGFGQQRIHLKVKKTELAAVLRSIEEKTSYRFLYNNDLPALRSKVTLNAKAATIEEILPMLFFYTDITYRQMANNLIVIKADPLARKDVTVSGTVTDSSGAPLSGVSVQVKGTTIGTATNTEGSFTLSVPEANSILVFTAVGYDEQEYPLNGQKTVQIQMQASQKLMDQVVVIGYGTARKRDLTGSVASISGEEVAKAPNLNPLSSLQGKVAGLTISNSGSPGAAPTVRIRGVNSTNSAAPLYVVDGILQDNIDFLNPADIETIDVLRDPSSIAIYGLRGANGVIAITSKKAARGQTRIQVQSSVGIQKVTNKIDVTDAAGFKKLYTAQLANLNAQPFDFKNFTANTDWQNLILRKALMQNHTVSVSNSGEKSTTLFSLGYNNQEGVVKNSAYERVVLRLNQELRINKNIKIGGDITGTYWNLEPTAVSLNNAIWAVPIVPVQADADTYYSMPSFQRVQVGNPVAALNRGDGTSINRGYRFLGSIFAEIKFLQNFTFKSIFYTDLGFNNTRSYSPLPYRYININETGAPDTTFDNTARTSVSQSQAEYRKFQQDYTLTYDKNFGGVHRVTAMAGLTSVSESNTAIDGNRRDTTVVVPNDPDYWYLNVINGNSNPGTFNGTGGKNNILGAFGRVSYAYKNKYLVNATIRRDGSSKFAPENRWGNFGSVGVGWVASEEPFFEGITGIDFLKLRGAWGKIGNANGFANNLWQPGISNASTAVFGDNIYTAIQAAYIPDPDLHWEVVRGIDLGLDIRALESRLSAEVNLYDRTTSDILTQLPIPNDSRFYFTNLGKITNRGIEVSMGWNDHITEDFTYAINANFSYNKNEVNSIGDNINFQILGNGGVNKTETGKSIGYFYGYKQVGIYQTTADLTRMPALSNSLPGDIAYADVDNDKVITPDDRTYLGTPFPPYNFGSSITLGYKGFDFQIDGQGVAGNKIYTQRRVAQFAPLNYESNRLNAWTTAGSTNIEPILDNSRGNNYLFSSYYLEPGDFFRLRLLQLGYTFNTRLLERTFIKAARIYLSGQNVKTWSKVTGYSPEAPIGSITGGGADNGTYPVPAIYTFGVNVTF